ncbi:LYHRT protein [Rhizophagus clarus]|uniref:LYHRT protein n=1 Tax=Rhizophagus clarus TaxID=94130 RepID=A0A8H3QN27_9GLOM|nr:LYHRT protein [Rhizophagus clarus]
MVSFSCDSCADIVKKPKAQSHFSRCPNAQFTCIDCNTTFHGNNFMQHTSCISEAEKYQKKLYKSKQDAPNKQKRQKVGTPNNINRQPLEGGEQSNKLDNGKVLDSSEQDQIPNINTDNNKSQNQEPKFKKKNKNKNKKNQQQDDQQNGNNVGIKVNMEIEMEVEKDNTAKAIDCNSKAQRILDKTLKQEDNNIAVNSRKRKNKRSKINDNDDNKVEESKRDSNNILDSNESQYVQTYVANETSKKEDNVNLNNSSGKKKKKKKRKNDAVNKNNNNNLVNIDAINGASSLVGILKKELSDEKSKKRKSVEFALPEPSNNKKINENDRNAKKSKLSHENDVTNDLFNYCERIPAAVKKIFKSNNYEELNLKRLEEMVVRQLISSSNSSESELKEKFLENIVLIMKDGEITLK